VTRVAVDATALVAGSTGVARYAAELLRGLARHDDLDIAPFAIGRGPTPPHDVRRLRVPLRVVQPLWRWTGLPRAEHLVGGCDVVHSLDIVPVPTRRPLVVTVHDVLPLTIPHRYQDRQRRMIEAQVAALARAHLVVTTCEATKSDLVAHAAVRPERILVAPLGHRPPSTVAPPAPVPGPYVLGVGSVTPRKGFQVLARAVARLGDDAPPVVIAGPDGWQADEVRAEVHRLGVADRITFLGRVDDDVLEGLYRHALVLCHPSEAEGFGIPVLEAMACDVPVVTTDVPAIREVAGDAALVVPVGDVDALAAGLARAWSDEAWRAETIRRGRDRCERYSWDACVDGLVGLYRSARAGSGRLPDRT
jgi:glycosyltransferase involved in cell wall biosynthesis